MKKLLVMTVLALFSVGAMADATSQPTAAGDGSSAAASASHNTSDASNQGITVYNGDYYEDGATRSTDGITRNQGSLEYSGEYSLKNVPTVSAPGLTTTMTETCMGSTSAGAGWVGFGFSFGTTWRDNACVRRLDARQLAALGYNLGAKELMCDSDAVRAALQRAGKPCYVDLPPEQKRPEDRQVIVAPVPSNAGGAGQGW